MSSISTLSAFITSSVDFVKSIVSNYNHQVPYLNTIENNYYSFNDHLINIEAFSYLELDFDHLIEDSLANF